MPIGRSVVPGVPPGWGAYLSLSRPGKPRPQPPRATGQPAPMCCWRRLWRKPRAPAQA
jgi:hypothetical protein